MVVSKVNVGVVINSISIIDAKTTADKNSFKK